MKKRTFAFLLALVMLLSMFPIYAAASDESVDESSAVETEAEEEAPAEEAAPEVPAEESAPEEPVEEPAEEAADAETAPVEGEILMSAVAAVAVEPAESAVMPAAKDDWNDKEDNKQDEPSQKTDVDHIDIDINLQAVVVINGKEYTKNFTIGTNDASKVSVSAAQNGSTVSFTRSGVSTSTDGDGNSQIRLEGTYPVGTQSNPVKYTVTYKGTVDVEADDGKTHTVPVTLTVTTGYWDSGNVCPGLGNSSDWQNGSVVGGSGIDLKLGVGSGSSDSEGDGEDDDDDVTSGVLQIQKTIVGVTAAEDQTYTVEIYSISDETETLYDTKTVTVSAGDTMASVMIANVPLGTYKVVEKVEGLAAINGYTWKEVKYVTGDTKTISASDSNETFAIENTYVAPAPEEPEAEKGSLTVSKSFEGDLTAQGIQSVTVKVEGGEYSQELTLSAENNWKATVSDLEVGEYTVTETGVTAAEGVDLTAYTLTVTGEGKVEVKADAEASAAIVNNYDEIEDEPETPDEPEITYTEVSVKKVWKDHGAADRPDSIEVGLYADGELVNLVALSADNSWTYTWTELDDSYEYTVEEVEVPDGYISKVTADGYRFTITNYEKSVPVTGDNGMEVMWAMLMVMSAAVLAALALNGKKRYNGK